MTKLTQLAQQKADAFTDSVISDGRWQLEDELMCQVFGFVLFGYLLGVGRTTCFMDLEDIQAMAAGKLVGLGIGPDYAHGLMDHAWQEFTADDDESPYVQMIGIGHSQFASENLDELVDSVFDITGQIHEAGESSE